MNITLTSERTGDRRFQFFMLHDQILTPLFSYVAIFNSLVAYERQAGAIVGGGQRHGVVRRQRLRANRRRLCG